MKNPNDSFIKGRLRGGKFAIKGIWLLLTTQDSIKAQATMAIIAIIAGFYFNISAIEWMVQLLVIGLVLVTEALNTAVEKIADFMQPAYDKKIGFIKDISAGAAAFAAFISLVLACIIYLPKITNLLA